MEQELQIGTLRVPAPVYQTGNLPALERECRIWNPRLVPVHQKDLLLVQEQHRVVLGRAYYHRTKSHLAQVLLLCWLPQRQSLLGQELEQPEQELRN